MSTEEITKLRQIIFDNLKETIEISKSLGVETDSFIYSISQQLAEITYTFCKEVDVNTVAFDKISLELDQISKRLDTVEETLGLDDPIFIRG
jgi:hypothetical protein